LLILAHFIFSLVSDFGHLLIEECACPLKPLDYEFGSGSFDVQHLRSFGYCKSLIQNQPDKLNSLLDRGRSYLSGNF
jgi:hypothetical protein